MSSSLTPITNLKVINANMTNRLMIEAKQYISFYSKAENVKYLRPIFKSSNTFEDLCKRFSNFESMISWKDPCFKTFDTELLQRKYHEIMDKSHNLSILPKFSNQEKIKRNAADYYRINKQYTKA